MNAPEITRSNLADAFKGAGAEDAADLTGLLAPRKPVTRTEKNTPPPAPPVAKGSTGQDSAAPTPEPMAPVKAAPKRAVTPSGDATRNKVDNVAAYIDPEVLAAVRAARREGVPAGDPEKTYDELLVDALERVSLDQIRGIFAPEDENSEGGLLQRRKRRTRGGGGTQIQLRMSKIQEEELIALTESVSAPSRSAFVTAVYRLAFLKE